MLMETHGPASGGRRSRTRHRQWAPGVGGGDAIGGNYRVGLGLEPNDIIGAEKSEESADRRAGARHIRPAMECAGKNQSGFVQPTGVETRHGNEMNHAPRWNVVGPQELVDLAGKCCSPEIGGRRWIPTDWRGRGDNDKSAKASGWQSRNIWLDIAAREVAYRIGSDPIVRLGSGVTLPLVLPTSRTRAATQP